MQVQSGTAEDRRVIRPTPILLTTIIGMTLALPALALAHGASEELYETTITAIEPDGLPIDVSMNGDKVRFQNHGDEELVVCGYEDQCEGWVRVGPEGVFEDRNSRAFHANAEADELGTIPEGAGEGEPEWHEVRAEPAFYAYHDHRVHWMGGESLPPGVDEGDPARQHVYDGVIPFRYGDNEGEVRARLDYVGGQSWMQQYGEYAITGAGVAAMLLFFGIDSHRRRRRREAAQAEGSAEG